MESKITHVIKRSGAIVPFNKERIANAIYRAAVTVGGRDRNRAEELADQVVVDLEQQTAPGHMPHIEEIQDIVEKVLIENGHAKVAKEYILYRNERNRKRQLAIGKTSHPSENIPWAKIWHTLDWAVSRNLHTVEALNERVRLGEFSHIVHESESAYEDDVTVAADEIIGRGRELKLVIICGPSSSGKTTTTMKLEKVLGREGLKFVTLNVDNYFFDLEVHPKDEFGDYDFETPQSLDLPLVNEHLRRLVAGEEVKIPYYDFKTSRRFLDQTPMRLHDDEILLIDSLHGLYPAMSDGIEDETKFKLYLEPLLQLKSKNGYVRWTDLRLIRRMLRDESHRAYNPRQTLEHWHYVRASEQRNIVPFISTTDFIINSGMPYELCLYRPKLLDSFRQWEEDYKDDPLRPDAFLRAARVRQLLEEISPVEDDSAVPPESVLREFIGGSVFSY
jgi:uridine kinase